jgi:hypothetical protein
LYLAHLDPALTPGEFVPAAYPIRNHLDLSLLKVVSGKPPGNTRAAIPGLLGGGRFEARFVGLNTTLPLDAGLLEQFPKNINKEHLTEAIKNLRPDHLSIVDGVGMFTALAIDRIKTE